MHSYVVIVESAWKIDIQLFSIFLFVLLLVNGIFGVAPAYAIRHYNPCYEIIKTYMIRHVYRVRHNYGNTHFMIVLDENQPNLKICWTC